MKRHKVSCKIKKRDRISFYDSYYGRLEGIVESIRWYASGMTLLVPEARVKITNVKVTTGYKHIDPRDAEKIWESKKFNKKRFFE